MKIAISIIFTFITISVYSQKPPKGTFKIIVLNTLSKDENSLKVCQTLLTNGYLIDIKKPDSVESVRKRIHYSDATYSLTFETLDSSIILTGKLFHAYMPRTLSKSIYWPVGNVGKKSSIHKVSFNEMYFIAKKLGSNMAFVAMKPE